MSQSDRHHRAPRHGRHRMPPGRHRRPPTHGPRLAAAAAASGVLVAAGVTWIPTSAAFTARADNGAGSWSTGTVTLTDSAAGTAMFGVTGAMPGDTYVACIRVTFAGSLAAAAPVRVYATNSSGGFRPYLRLTVDQGSGTSADCSDFVSATTLFDAGTPAPGAGTLGAFSSAHSSPATGVGAWTPTLGDQARTYRFLMEVVPDNGGQGATAQATMTWMTQA